MANYTIDYAEEIFNSIKTIAKKEIESMSFDITIEATITDDKKSKYGTYIVTNGSTYFTAYSINTDYREGDSVLITIPKGDYSQQKMIIGKKNVSNEDNPTPYTSLFSKFLDITNNLVLDPAVQCEMIANGDNYAWESDDFNNFIQEAYQDTPVGLVWSARNENSNFKEESGFTRIGLKADFKTLLKQYNTVLGNYGLVLCVGFRNPDSININNNFHSTIIQPFVFDSKDFFGDVYNFETSYTQEALFDISNYSNLILSDIFLFAYQKKNFKNISGDLIPIENVASNIFINNIYVCLGTELSNFEKDSASIYSLSETIYNKENNIESNIKNINLRWIHRDENSDIIKSLVKEEIPEDYEIRWYRNELGASNPDDFIEAHWVRYYGYSNDINEYNDDKNDQTTNNFSIQFYTNPLLNKQSIQAAIVKTKQFYNNESQKWETKDLYLIAKSNILSFTNEKEISAVTNAIKDINALSIKFEDDEKGNYFIYDNLHKIKNEKQNIIRKLQAVFSDNIEDIYKKSNLQTYDRITWKIPAKNSMIIPLDFMENPIESYFKNTAKKQFSILDDELGYNYSIIYDDEFEYYKLTHIKKNSDDNIFKSDEFYTAISYQINDTLDFNKGQNTIFLEVEKNGLIYPAQATMVFDISGSSGSDYTLKINWNNQDKRNYFDISYREEESSLGDSLVGNVVLQDPDGYKVDLNDQAQFEYSWYKHQNIQINEDIPDQPTLAIISNGDNESNFTIKRRCDIADSNFNYSPSMDELYILEVKLIGFGNYELVTRVPIILTQLYYNNNKIFNIDQFDGTNTVYYSVDGILSYNKTPYNIQLSKAVEILEDNLSIWEQVYNCFQTGRWQLLPKNNTLTDLEKNTTPQLMFLSTDNEATINKVFSFFINNEENVIDDKKRLFYRLMQLTTFTDEQDNLQLYNLSEQFNSELQIKNLVNNLNNPIPTLGQENTNLINFSDLVSNYQELFINSSNNIIHLLHLLELIAFYSNDYIVTNNEQEEATLQLTSLLKTQNWKNYIRTNLLLPPNFYLSNSPLYGVQFIYQSNNREIVLLTQPIYVYQENYALPTINKWDGKLVIQDNSEINTIFAKGMVAGTKDEQNQFSGVILGDWSKENIATSMTGIYGFYKNKMSYALRENGSAFFGTEKGRISLNENAEQDISLKVQDNNNLVEIKPGYLLIATKNKPTDSEPNRNLLYIDNNNYLLQSKNFSNENQMGMKFNLQDGKIEGYNFSLLTKTQKYNIDYSLELSSGNDNNLSFLRIGRRITDNQNILLNNNTTSENEIISKVEAFKNIVDNYDENIVLLYYNYFLSLISDFKDISTIDTSLYKTELTNDILYTDKQMYEDLLNYPYRYIKTNDTSIVSGTVYYEYKNGGYNTVEEPVIDDINNYYEKEVFSRDSLLLHILNNLTEPNKTQMTEIDNETEERVFNENWYFNWNFDEIPNSFLVLLSDQQIYNLKKALQTFTQTGEINKIELDRNLFYPKIPFYKYNDQTYANTIFQEIMQPYYNIINRINSQNITLEDINKVNQIARNLINNYNLSSLDYNYKNIIFNNMEYSYIEITNGIIPSINTVSGGSYSSSQTEPTYYLAKNGNTTTNAYTYKNMNFTKEETHVFYDDQPTFMSVYKISIQVDPDSTFQLIKHYQNTSAQFGGTYIFDDNQLPSSHGNTAFDFFSRIETIKYNKTIVDIYFIEPGHFILSDSENFNSVEEQFKAYYDLDHVERLWANSYSDATSDRMKYFLVGVKIKEPTALIGKQKIENNIQRKLLNYQYKLSECQKLVSFTNENFNIWLYNNYYSNIVSTITNIRDEYNDILLKYNNYEIYIQIPFNYEVRQKIRITQSEIGNFYYYKENAFSPCSEENFYYSLNTNEYAFKDNDSQLYYIKLTTGTSIYGYSYLYNYTTNNNSGFFHIDQITGRHYYSPLTYLKISDLALSIFQESEKIYLSNQQIENLTENDDVYIFDEKSWENDLININKNGGYLTSKNYRPTVYDTDKQMMLPTDDQNKGSPGWSQGMKGLVIDLTNDRIVFGNNAEIQGFQTQYYPGETNISHRSFIISTGAKFLSQSAERDKLFSANNNCFIIARAGWSSSSTFQLNPIIFDVKWDGTVECYKIKGLATDGLTISNSLTVNNNLTVKNTLNTQSFKINNNLIYIYEYETVNITDKYGTLHPNIIQLTTTPYGSTDHHGLLIVL